jgi:DNA-binding MarR family transcriptional regulator
MKELAEKLGITTGTLTVQVEKLVSSQLLERLPDPSDRRAIVVALTEDGKAIHKQHNLLHLNLVKDLTTDVHSDHQQVLINCLKKMNQGF